MYIKRYMNIVYYYWSFLLFAIFVQYPMGTPGQFNRPN